MTVHQFGGDWTQKKLMMLKKYLIPYRQIMDKQPWAKTFYIDAFAGSGTRVDSNEQLNLDEDAESYKYGSVHVPLQLDSAFDEYIFVEKRHDFAVALEQLKTEYPQRNIRIEHSEANTFLLKWCKAYSWQTERAVLFLDPYGMQVKWSTLEAIARTSAIDLWLWFPVGMGVNRLLTKKGQPSEAMSKVLSNFFGNDEWRERFYKPAAQASLFDANPHEKQVNIEAINAYFVERLKTIFPGVAANPKTLCNSRNSPLYALHFAAGNPRAVGPAINIAQHILGKDA